MMDWTNANYEKPEQIGDDGEKFSEIVDVLLDSGEQSEDFLYCGDWVLYSEKNKSMPQIEAWRYKNEDREG